MNLKLSVILCIAIDSDQFYISVFSNDAEIKNKLYDNSVRNGIYNIMEFEGENENNFLYQSMYIKMIMLKMYHLL